MKANWNLLNDAEDAAFDAGMLEWQRTLNLLDWRIERGRRAPVSSMALVKCDYGARLAAFRTGNWGAAEKTPRSIRETALHESLYILLFELLHLTRIGADEGVLESAEHRVVTTLEKILMGTNS